MVNKLNQGFSFVELIVAMIIASILMGTIIYVVGEANFFLNKQMYRENVDRYANFVMEDIFSSIINAQNVDINNRSQIICGYKTDSGYIDSLKIYQSRLNQGILVNGVPLEFGSFHDKDKNRNYYMQITEFSANRTFTGYGYAPEVRDAVIDVFLGIKLSYKRGKNSFVEEFPYKKTIFNRAAAVYSLGNNNND